MSFRKKLILEYALVILIFSLSCINPVFLYIAMSLSLIYLFQGRIGIVKLEFLLILRTVISPGLLFDIHEIPSFQFFKWMIIFGGSFYLIIKSKNIDSKMTLWMLFFLIFILYITLSTLFFSNKPILGVFKIINYAVPLIAFYLNRDYLVEKKIVEWIENIMLIIIFSSLPLLFLPLGYLRNQTAFQGITDNPNMFGIVLVLAYSFILKGKHNLIINVVLSFLVIFLIFLSDSRTSLISIFILILLFLLKNKRIYPILLLLFPSLLVIYYFFNDKLSIVDLFLRKGDNTEILYSRTGQIETTKMAFINSPFFGNGFGIPYNPHDIADNNQTIVEAGNLFLAILMFSGIFGLIIFLLLIIYWAYKVKREYQLLFLSVLLINMGEMVLFSSNSIGLWCSLIWAISLPKINKSKLIS